MRAIELFSRYPKKLIASLLCLPWEYFCQHLHVFPSTLAPQITFNNTFFAMLCVTADSSTGSHHQYSTPCITVVFQLVGMFWFSMLLTMHLT
jgi:hypothetical protein